MNINIPNNRLQGVQLETMRPDQFECTGRNTLAVIIIVIIPIIIIIIIRPIIIIIHIIIIRPIRLAVV